MSTKTRITSVVSAALLVAAALASQASAQAGALDATFSGDGKTMLNFSAGSDWVEAVVVQPDGKIVTAGGAAGGKRGFVLARHNPDGSLDTSFGGDGRVTTKLSGGLESVGGLALQVDGKIVVAGGAGGRLALARYNADGSLDATFSGDGTLTTNFTSGFDYATSVELQGDGKIAVAGTADYTKRAARFALARYEPDGALDSTFGGDGRVLTNLTAWFDGAYGIAVQPADGKIIAVGWADHMMGLVRYETDGTLDPTFSGGVVLTDFTTGADYASAVELQGDGKIVVAGSADYFGRNSRFALARYTADGALDSTFAGFGRVTTNFTPRRDRAFALALQPDGKIVAAGEGAGRGGRFAVARYLAS